MHSSPLLTPRHVNPKQSQLNPKNSNKVTRGLIRADSLTGVQVTLWETSLQVNSNPTVQNGKRLKNTRIDLQKKDSTIMASETTEARKIWFEHFPFRCRRKELDCYESLIEYFRCRNNWILQVPPQSPNSPRPSITLTEDGKDQGDKIDIMWK